VNPARVIGGRYVVLGELGRGGMGVVWRAEDRVMGRHVAVKELHLPAGLSPDERLLFRERLLREARTAGRLNDPGIVTVYDVVTDEGVDHIVMELIEARTLAEMVATRGPLDERTATAVARQLLAALGTAHENGVVHRDVKPSNVMLGPGGRVKLTDFGVAQAVDDPRLTSTGTVVGSPGYLSPERLEGGPATPAADLWALGATLFFAVQGTGPFERENTAATISAVLHAEVPPTRCRGPLAAVIAGLMMRPPQARLAGPQAAALLGGSTTSSYPGADAATGPVARSGPARDTRRRLWVLVALAIVTALILGVLAGATLLRGGSDRDVATLTYGPDGDILAYEMFGAACLNGQLTPGRMISTSARVSCDEPHELEVFQTLDPFGSRQDLPYPGVEAFTRYAAAACTLVFDSDLVRGEDKDRLAVAALIPSPESFAARSDVSSSFPSRDVVCLLRSADGNAQLLGSRIAEPTG
jgi:serine/threonine protein kinase